MRLISRSGQDLHAHWIATGDLITEESVDFLADR